MFFNQISRFAVFIRKVIFMISSFAIKNKNVNFKRKINIQSFLNHDFYFLASARFIRIFGKFIKLQYRKGQLKLKNRTKARMNLPVLNNSSIKLYLFSRERKTLNYIALFI